MSGYPEISPHGIVKCIQSNANPLSRVKWYYLPSPKRLRRFKNCKFHIKSSLAWPPGHPPRGFFFSDLHPRLENSVRPSPAFGRSKGSAACCCLPLLDRSPTQGRRMKVKEADHLPRIVMVMLTWAYRYYCCCYKIGCSAARADAASQKDSVGPTRLHLV